jgi:lipopolysaccharide export system protein LptA
MHPIRLLRILVPILLLAFVIAMAFTFRSHAPRKTAPADVSADPSSRMEGFRFNDLVGGRRRMLVEAKVGRVDDKGAFDLEQVERMEVDREGQGPLVLTADRGAGSGVQGKRIVRLDGGVTVRDDTGLGLEIASVEIDQVAGIVRSLGVVRLHNGEWKGTADEVVYDLAGRPTQIRMLRLDGPDGGHLSAEQGSIPAGARTITLSGNVDASQGGIAMHAGDAVLTRRADGKIESVTATPAVTGVAGDLGGGAAAFAAHEVHAVWDHNGRVSDVVFSGRAELRHSRGTIAAERIEAKAVDPAGSFVVDAAGEVVASGPTPKGKGELSCDALHAVVDAKGVAHDGLATGNVRFDGDGTAGEAAEASFTSLAADGNVTLKASASRRARLAFARERIIAETIVSDVRGVNLRAEGRVESTLLPAPNAKGAGISPMFTNDEAVHFVSSSLESAGSGAHLTFRGDVRGWQGERTLSADEVELVQAGNILNATGHVSTRMPREVTRAASDADYVQIGADRLAYRGAAHNAEYDGSVKLRQAEGWLQTPHLTATLAEGGPGLKEVQALHGVRFEYRAPGEHGIPTTATGDGDRLVYDTAARVLRVYGDKAPATVRSTGPNAGTTVGRVLRYQLDSGALEVESGERDRATIRTPKS